MKEPGFKPVIGISIGDINGIGPEVIIKTFSDKRIFNQVIPVVYGSGKVLSYYKKVLEADHFNFATINDVDGVKEGTVNVINCFEKDITIKMGQVDPVAGQLALKALSIATDALLENKIDALVTAPVNKNNIPSDNGAFTGHTAFLTKKAGEEESLMLLIGQDISVGLVTEHVPVSELSKVLTRKLILRKIKILHKTLKQDLGINQPKIAVLGLNPHAGDGGLIGKEEEEIIIPALEEARNNKMLVMGPFPADGFFGSGQYRTFDTILAMYHDQGLIPFKTLNFGEGVNFTAGLPFVRTSPDHGTAYTLSGENKADPGSFRQAVFAARDIVRRRRDYISTKENALKPSSKGKH